MSIWDFPTKLAPGPDVCRMFQSDLVERFSRFPPATPLVFWAVTVVLILIHSASRGEVGLTATLGLVAGGVLTWSFMEYVLHRWIFHWTEDSPRGRRIHFLLHGVHHDYPNDRMRLVMPLGFSIPLAALFLLVFIACVGDALAEPLFAGLVTGYLLYDAMHYAMHHFAMPTRAGRWLKKHHMKHHHLDHAGGFGVSSPLWDLVFRTMPR